MSKPASHATPEDLEQAFYDALNNGDADLLIQAWAEDEEVLCVHPTGVRLTGLVPSARAGAAYSPTAACASRPSRSRTGRDRCSPSTT